MPKVKEVMQTIFNKAPNKVINPNKCVAIGATI
jgi:molecular chaperone DnaK (HSP70)